MKMNSKDYRALAEFRYQIRTFLAFSETAAREQGLNGQQHQLLLAIKGLPENSSPSIGVLAERMQLQHHTTVELVDRLSERGCIKRETSPTDRRQVHLRITARGENLLRKLTAIHEKELQSSGPLLLATLRKLTHVRG
jgi:DNA-binding MarR family transcriptional regulator